MGRFASTVAYYERARQPYSSAFFATVARELDVGRAHRLIDLGTGPGVLALGFAPFCGDLTGVDPEPAMIAAARQAARRAGVALRLVEGRVEDLPRDIGSFDVVTIGRALHWMEPAATRDALEGLVRNGGVALICRASTVAEGNPWLSAYDAVRKRWSEGRESGRGRIDLDAFFSGTRLRRGPTLAVETEQSTPIERLLDRALSMSTSSPERLGPDEAVFRAALGEALAPFARDGAIEERVRAQAEVFIRAS